MLPISEIAETCLILWIAASKTCLNGLFRNFRFEPRLTAKVKLQNRHQCEISLNVMSRDEMLRET
ncbi:hypothetical protein T4D_8678 [Trichinella pseudospiralis]|uniref:Uncharacterized protein n=1 Tax=Trichinella pseudospiralis TaxID=6337 RepID=A0A0V1FXM8_TRIPS|nr:hypothetical protein T4D_8678 [Trichinella pseudospiralis]